jgi:hypothetical protein
MFDVDRPFLGHPVDPNARWVERPFHPIWQPPWVAVQLEEVVMQASVGDRIVIHGHRYGESDRDCEVLEVRGPEGAPPYVVRWGENGHETFFFPGRDASVQHFEHSSP